MNLTSLIVKGSSACAMLFLMGCQLSSTENIPKGYIELKGNLHFSALRFSGLYDVRDSLKSTIISAIESDSLGLIENDLLLYQQYSTLKKENLLLNPYLDIKTDSGTIVTVYLGKQEYKKIAPTHYHYLFSVKKNIGLQMIAKRLSDRLYYSESIIGIDTVEDNSLPKEGKFKIKDYL